MAGVVCTYRPVFSTEFTGQRSQILSHDHAHHLECSDCQYQTLVECVLLSTKHLSSVQSSMFRVFKVQVVQVGVKNMFVLRWSQKVHYWFWVRPKGHIRGPKWHSALWKRPERTLVQACYATQAVLHINERGLSANTMSITLTDERFRYGHLQPYSVFHFQPRVRSCHHLCYAVHGRGQSELHVH